MYVMIKQKRMRLDPSHAIGKGGEADVYSAGGGIAVKIFKPPDHSDLYGRAAEQAAAAERLKVHQRKLPDLMAFGSLLPRRVVLPTELAEDGGRIVGYTMPLIEKSDALLSYADRTFRDAGISSDIVRAVFLDLLETVQSVHRAGVVIGDFNDLNVLVRGTEAYLIDMDSAQFGRYLCTMFTPRFVDPLRCDPKAKTLTLVRPHASDSDWYAFAVMLMQCLLFVSPYGGTYRPKDPAKRIPHELRPLKRITVFTQDVRYPKPAIPYGVLPDDLLQHFHRVFHEDARGEFPRKILEGLRWTTCSRCGAEHARAMCPVCSAPGLVKETVRIRGTVRATRIFKTSGTIVSAAIQQGSLAYLYHENGWFVREDGSRVVAGALDPWMRFRIQGKKTLIGRGSRVAVLEHGVTPTTLMTGTVGNIPIFDANITHRYWIANGMLMRDAPVGPRRIGDVLSGQTLFWVGERFGLGFYRAGSLAVAFIFDAERTGMNDSVPIPALPGKLIDATTAFAHEQAWFFTAIEDQGSLMNRCFVVRRDGTVVGTAEAMHGDGTWLGMIHGQCAVGQFLLAATDDGIVRVEASGGSIAVTREFPDTEPFVHAGARLIAVSDGLAVVTAQEVTMLVIT
ncbi:MAG: hypothetical protein HY460_01340 [Parcubacteria group bacterium]|nr:hypothetical protein [Parcubacteria group bacterium]